MNLIRTLCSQIGVYTLEGLNPNRFSSFSPTTQSLTDMSIEGFVLIVFTVLPIKRESMKTTH